MMYNVTIGIPFYNAEKYLHDTLLSVLAQDYESIEYLLLNDCSTDGSVNVIRQLQQEHPRGRDIRVVSQPVNKGVGAARNRILDEARGRYLFFMDADDLIRSDTISLLVATAEKHRAEVVMASYERVEMYHETPQHVKCQLPHRVFSGEHELACFAFSSYGAVQATVANTLMELELIRTNRLRFIETNYWEDLAFKYTLVTYVTRAVLLSDITYSYMCREQSLSNFQKRYTIRKEEFLNNAATLEQFKQPYKRLLGKPYFSGWLSFALQTDFYIVREALRSRKLITPSISDAELMGFFHSPLSLAETFRYGNARCCFFKLLGILPHQLGILIIKVMSLRH